MRWLWALLSLAPGCDVSDPSGLQGVGHNRTCRLASERYIMNFGTLAAGRSTTRALEFRFVQTPCTLPASRLLQVVGDGLEISGLESLGFEAGSKVPAGAWLAVALAAHAVRPGTHRVEATYELLDDGGRPLQTYTLVVAGAQAPEPDVVVVPNELFFGTTCGPASKAVTLTNPASVPASVRRVGVQGRAFRAAAQTPLIIPPGESREIQVEFTPQIPGSFEGAVEIEIRVGDRTTTATVPVRGDLAEGAVPITQSFIARSAPQLDLVIVVDPSTADRHRPHVERGLVDVLDGVMNRDPRDWDVHVAVTTSDMEAEAGRFVPVDGTVEDWQVTRHGSSDPAAQLLDRLDRIAAGIAPNRTLDAVHAAVSATNLGAENRAFLRPRALTAILAVTDRSDASERAVDDVLNFILSLKGACGPCADRVRFRSASGGLNGCTFGSADAAQPAPRLVELADRSGGATVSLCRPDWGEGIEWFEDLDDVYARPTEYVLQQPPQVDTIRIQIDDQPIDPEGGAGWSYDPDAQQIVFGPDTQPRTGSEVVVEFWSRCR